MIRPYQNPYYNHYIKYPHHRHSIRLQKHNYSSNCTYFITIGSHKHGYIFGEIKNGLLLPNDIGNIVINYLNNLSIRFPCIKIMCSQLMPNHLHFIIQISPLASVGANHDSPLQKRNKRSELSKIIGYLKANSTKEIRKIPHNPFYIWQRNYYEHIIHNESEIKNITLYIQNNPKNWQHDPENHISRRCRGES